VTATGGEKKFVAVTDQQGAYSFADLADWRLDDSSRNAVLSPPSSRKWPWRQAPPTRFGELKVLSLEEIHATAAAPAAAQPVAAATQPAQPRQGRQESRDPKSAAATPNPQAGFPARRGECDRRGRGAGRPGRGNGERDPGRRATRTRPRPMPWW